MSDNGSSVENDVTVVATTTTITTVTDSSDKDDETQSQSCRLDDENDVSSKPTVRFAPHLAIIHEIDRIDPSHHAAVWYSRLECAAMVQDVLGHKAKRGSTQPPPPWWQSFLDYVSCYLPLMVLVLAVLLPNYHEHYHPVILWPSTDLPEDTESS